MKSISTTRVGHKVKGSRTRCVPKPFGMKEKCQTIAKDDVGSPDLGLALFVGAMVDQLVAEEDERLSKLPACLRPR
jgi:hypothetical protein